MAIRYTGFGDTYSATLILYGDGTSTSVSIDVTLSPFDIDFSKGGATGAFLASPTSDPAATISYEPSNNTVTVNFEFPPAEVSYTHPTPGGRQLVIRFLYG
jgi:hypothetical protein